jgi:hypothetical protein
MMIGRWGADVAKWTKDDALVALKRFIAQIDLLKSSRRYSAEHTQWLFGSRRLLEDVFGASSPYSVSFGQLTWQQSPPFIIPPGHLNPQAGIDRVHHQAYLNQLDTAKGILGAAHDELESSDLDEVYKGKDSAPESSAILRILHLAEHKLRKAIRTPPGREKEVQDAFETLLIGAEIDYSRETDSIEYSSKTYTPDFTFTRLDVALEVKFCSRSDREKEIIAEINDDILAYSQKYGNLVFVIYDTGFIRDIDRFARHFEEREGVMIRVVKH